MAARGIVSVTVNYRLGVFGFFAHPELTADSVYHASGNPAGIWEVEGDRSLKPEGAADD